MYDGTHALQLRETTRGGTNIGELKIAFDGIFHSFLLLFCPSHDDDPFIVLTETKFNGLRTPVLRKSTAESTKV